MIEPPMPSKGMHMLTWCMHLWRFVRASRVIPGPGMAMKETPSGTILSVKVSKCGASAPPAEIRPFGQIITWDDNGTTKTGIRGGVIVCGDQTWNMDHQVVNPQASGTWLVSIAVTAEVNRDDDNELLLPGVKTGTKPSGDWTKTVWSSGANYPDGTAPTVSSGEVTILLPIRKLIIQDESVRLEATGSGGFTLGHCSGSITFTRV